MVDSKYDDYFADFRRKWKRDQENKYEFVDRDFHLQRDEAERMFFRFRRLNDDDKKKFHSWYEYAIFRMHNFTNDTLEEWRDFYNRLSGHNILEDTDKISKMINTEFLSTLGRVDYHIDEIENTDDTFIPTVDKDCVEDEYFGLYIDEMISAKKEWDKLDDEEKNRYYSWYEFAIYYFFGDDYDCESLDEFREEFNITEIKMKKCAYYADKMLKEYNED